MEEVFNYFLITMSVIALFVFVALYFVDAGYGMMINKKWGWAIPNKIGWILMESPVFIVMTALMLFSPRKTELVPLVIFALFQLHYFQRSFIFPLLMKGKSKMPIAIVAMGMLFNTLNGIMQGGWIFYIAPDTLYTSQWLYSPQFIIGAIIFFVGMAINLHSDHIVRNLRKPGDTKHYIPRGGMYNYVCSSNYFGELVEWTGFAILTWSSAGLVFVWWTFANLVPRANTIHKKYLSEFGEEYKKLNRKRIIPFIY